MRDSWPRIAWGAEGLGLRGILAFHEAKMIARRELLKTGVALAAGAALARPQSSAPPKAKITSSVMLWTLKGSFDEKLETAARAGMQSVELIGEYAQWSDADIARVKKTARSF